jgi:hypothetical protein
MMAENAHIPRHSIMIRNVLANGRPRNFHTRNANTAAVSSATRGRMTWISKPIFISAS